MSRKHFHGLLIAAVLVLAAVFVLLPTRTAHETAESRDAWLEGLAGRANDVDRVEVTVPGGEVAATLERGEGRWTIAELGGYPADWGRLREVLAALAKAGVIEPKTSSPEYYDRLGVGDVANAEAAGVLLTLSAGEDRWAVIVGNAADSREGRYLRRADDAQSVLADFDAEVPRTALGWADAVIADLPAANVAEVEIIHPDRDRILVRKVSADETDYTLDNLPEGRELQSAWSANALGGVLASLRMEDVRAADTLDWTSPLLVRVLTFDGMEVRVEAVKDGEDNWLRLSATAPFANVVASEPGATPPGEDGTDVLEPGAAEPEAAAEIANEPSSADAVAEALDQQVTRFNERVTGWAYKVPGYKAEAMGKRLEDLLKPLDDGTDDA